MFYMITDIGVDVLFILKASLKTNKVKGTPAKTHARRHGRY